MERCILRNSLTAVIPTGVSLRNSAVIRLEIFQVLNHGQSKSRAREKNMLEISTSIRKDVGSEGEKQEKGRGEVKEKISHRLLMNRNTNTNHKSQG